MKTQKIVLALALAAVVTPAVVSAQDVHFGGTNDKMLYISDRALTRIRENHSVNNQQKQEPKKQTQQPQPSQPPKKTNTPTRTAPTNAYNYPGPEGKAMLAGELFWQHISERRQQRRAKKQANNNVPTYVRDANTVSNNHQVTLSNKAEERSARRTNSTFQQILWEVANAIVQEAPYMK